MAMYKRYTVTSSVQYLLSFCCPQCGTVNEMLCGERVQSRYDDMNALTNGAVDRRKYRANMDVELKRQALEQKIRTDFFQGRYRRMSFKGTRQEKCVCKNCKKVPLWTRLATCRSLFSVGKIIAIFLIPVALLYTRGNFQHPLIMGAVALAVVPFLIGYVCRFFIEINIARMDLRYLPHVAWSKEEHRRNINKLKIEMSTMTDNEIS